MTDTVDSFMSNSVVPPIVVTKGKKRKTTQSTEKEATDELRKRARLHCKCPEQWKIISRYNQKRLEEFICESDYASQALLFNSLFGFTHKVIALILDVSSAGDGFVREQVEADVTLRACIEQEASCIVQYLTNRWKMLALCIVDIGNGKQNQWKEAPPKQEECQIVEEENATYTESCHTETIVVPDVAADVYPDSVDNREEETSTDQSM